MRWMLSLLVLLPVMTSAEWIEAKPEGAGQTIWVDTDNNAIYVGGDCTPLMQLEHVFGKKPRSLK